MRRLGTYLCWMLLVCITLPNGVGAEPFRPQAGVHYEIVNPPVPVSGSKPEVVEVFNFKCPHCFRLHPRMEAWTLKMQDRFDIKSLPIVFSNQSDQPLRVFYAGQFMGQEKAIKNALFNAQFVDHLNIDSQGELAFIADNLKLDNAKFLAYQNSFGVNGKINQGRQLAKEYGVESTPTLVVNGRFRVSPGKHDNGDMNRLFEIVETLAQQ